MSAKLTFIGDHGVGKSSLQITIFTRSFPPFVSSLKDNFQGEFTHKNKTLSLFFEDTNGKDDFDRLRPLSYVGTDVLILCFDPTDVNSCGRVTTKWIKEIAFHCPDVPIVLVATKFDLCQTHRQAIVRKFHTNFPQGSKHTTKSKGVLSKMHRFIQNHSFKKRLKRTNSQNETILGNDNREENNDSLVVKHKEMGLFRSEPETDINAIQGISNDVFGHILTFLNFKDIHSCCLVSRLWYKYAACDLLWKIILHRVVFNMFPEDESKAIEEFNTVLSGEPPYFNPKERYFTENFRLRPRVYRWCILFSSEGLRLAYNISAAAYIEGSAKKLLNIDKVWRIAIEIIIAQTESRN